MISWRIFRASPPKTQFKERVGTSQYSLVIPLGRVSVHFRLQVVCGKFIGTHNFWSRISLRSWRYCVGARLKFWRRSRVPKKGSRNEAVDGYAVKSHSTILQRLRRQISPDYYTIPPATQASLGYDKGISENCRRPVVASSFKEKKGLFIFKLSATEEDSY